LWELVPTPDKAMRIRAASIAGILKSQRIAVSRPPMCWRFWEATGDRRPRNERGHERSYSTAH
jgi:hypothetical protein